jgi:hypothetical protein
MLFTETVALASRPSALWAAFGLLVADALLGAVSPHVLFYLSPASRGWELPFQPGVWILALLQILLALCLLRGVSWLRYLLAALVFGLITDQLLNTSLSNRFQSFPLATVRDGLSAVLQVAAVLLLFTSGSATWFRQVRSRGDA